MVLGGFAILFMEFCLRGWNPKRRVNASCGVDVGMVGAGLGDGEGMMIARGVVEWSVRLSDVE